MLRILSCTILAVIAFASKGKINLDSDNSKVKLSALWKPDDDEARKPFKEICNEAGFKFEKHDVTTEDGYKLTIFRIPGLKDEE